MKTEVVTRDLSSRNLSSVFCRERMDLLYDYKVFFERSRNRKKVIHPPAPSFNSKGRGEILKKL